MDPAYLLFGTDRVRGMSFFRRRFNGPGRRWVKQVSGAVIVASGSITLGTMEK